MAILVVIMMVGSMVSAFGAVRDRLRARDLAAQLFEARRQVAYWHKSYVELRDTVFRQQCEDRRTSEGQPR